MVINVAKIDGKGEDANPLCDNRGFLYYVGVFDGMGGSGAAEYATKDGTYTGAYLASRKVREVCEDFLKSCNDSAIDLSGLKTKIKQGLDDCIKLYDIKPSRLRSKMIRILPTTLAIVCANKADELTHVVSYWSGDSRNYILTKSGLKQISVDHLCKSQDPMENLRYDEALSNCICQDRDFAIEQYDCGIYEEPLIIISATDGCFGYLRSPMHFEYLLLKTLNDSDSIEEWKSSIEKTLSPVAGDDFSLGLNIVGGDFNYWKVATKSRLSSLEKYIISPIKKKEDALVSAKNKKEDKMSALYDVVTELWEKYKPDYMAIKK